MSTAAPAPVIQRQRTLLVWLGLFNVALLSCYSAFIVIFIPNQVQDFDPANKVANLAIVMTVSSIGAIFVHPIIGALSDRTRSRMGRRAPWMIVSAATAAVAMVVMAGSANLVVLGLYWFVVSCALNSLATAGAAVLPDRFAKERMGVASAAVALGIFLGMGVGVGVAGVFANSIGIGYTVFGIGILVVSCLFIVFNRDFSSKDMERPPFAWRAFFASFWVSPRRYPDFWWAFAGRFFLILAYQSVQSYLLYILRDYIGLSNDASTAISTPITAVMLVGALATTFFVGRRSDRIGRRKRFVVIASIVMAFSMLIPLVLPSLLGMFLLAAVFGLGYGTYMSVDSALMNEVLPSGEAAGKDLGILNAATTVPQALTPAIVGVIVLTTHGYTAVFVAGILFAVIGALTVLPIKSVR